LSIEQVNALAKQDPKSWAALVVRAGKMRRGELACKPDLPSDAKACAIVCDDRVIFETVPQLPEHLVGDFAAFSRVVRMGSEGFLISPPPPNDPFGQKNWHPIVWVRGFVFELNKAKPWTAASSSIGKVMNVPSHRTAMKLEPISILDRLVTFVQRDA
jgi:hypothetical protein